MDLINNNIQNDVMSRLFLGQELILTNELFPMGGLTVKEIKKISLELRYKTINVYGGGFGNWNDIIQNKTGWLLDVLSVKISSNVHSDELTYIIEVAPNINTVEISWSFDSFNRLRLLQNIKKLRLFYLDLPDIPPEVYNLDLEFLDISHNEISSLPYDFFDRLPSLKTLNISHNPINVGNLEKIRESRPKDRKIKIISA